MWTVFCFIRIRQCQWLGQNPQTSRRKAVLQYVVSCSVASDEVYRARPLFWYFAPLWVLQTPRTSLIGINLNFRKMWSTRQLQNSCDIISKMLQGQGSQVPMMKDNCVSSTIQAPSEKANRLHHSELLHMSHFLPASTYFTASADRLCALSISTDLPSAVRPG